MKVASVTNPYDGAEHLKFQAVAANGYPSDGSDENNTYAKWTPSASVEMTVTNPALHGQFKEGQTYYVDFVEASS